MANKNINQRVDRIEEMISAVQQELRRNHQDRQREVRSLKEEMSRISQQLALLLNQRADSAVGGSSRTMAEMTEKVTEADGVSPMKGETLEHARNSQIADNHSDFRFRRLEMPLLNGTHPDDEDEDVTTELLGDEEIKPHMTSTNSFKVELAEEVVSEIHIFGTANDNQLDAITNHGQIVDKIGKYLTKQGAATSPLPVSTKKKKKKKKKKEKETTFVKDRGKSTTPRRWMQRRRGGEPRRDQNLSKRRSSASASEKKKAEEVAVVKDRGKPCVAVQARGRRGSMTAAKYHGSRKRRGEGCEGVVMASRNEASEWPGVGAPHHRRSTSTVPHGNGEICSVVSVVCLDHGCCGKNWENSRETKMESHGPALMGHLTLMGPFGKK